MPHVHQVGIMGVFLLSHMKINPVLMHLLLHQIIEQYQLHIKQMVNVFIIGYVSIIFFFEIFHLKLCVCLTFLQNCINTSLVIRFGRNMVELIVQLVNMYLSVILLVVIVHQVIHSIHTTYWMLIF